MTLSTKQRERLAFLIRVVQKESKYLQATDHRLFETPFTLSEVAELETNQDLAERVEAFVGRFGRLQDLLGDKLLPMLLTLLGESVSVAIDNYDKAERLGFINSVDEWMGMRQLRNQMVHEYIEDSHILIDALNSGHAHVADLVDSANKMLKEIENRNFLH